MFFAASIFLISYALIMSEKVPHTIAAMVGGILMVIFGVLDQDKAIHYIDFDTIGLLCGMMIIVLVLKKTGLFQYLAIKSVKLSKGNPTWILVSLAVFTAVMSALLDNVTTVLIVAPITLAIADTLSISPIPFLVSEILFSNIGGTATLIGDPPNILIGNSSHLSFMSFITHNLPILLVIGVLTLIFLRFYYRKQLTIPVDKEKLIEGFDESKSIKNYKHLIICLIVVLLTFTGFILHSRFDLKLATIALFGGFTLLMITKTHPEEILKDIEWGTVFFFVGLFVLAGGLEATGLIEIVAKKMVLATNSIKTMSFAVLWGSAIASSIVDNIPFTATMIHVINSIDKMGIYNVQPLWWSLSLGACLGGNATIVGAAANVIVSSYAKANNQNIGFLNYMKVAVPVTIVAISLSMGYILLVDL